MHAEARRESGADQHPVAELLACPSEISALLNSAAQCIDFEQGDRIFRQGASCHGLYVVVSGQLIRRSERLESRIVLGLARPGDLVELAAVLSEGHHTYSLVAQSPGSLVLLPSEALQKAFASFPPLRMNLLEELAREVSRAYIHIAMACNLRRRHRTSQSSDRSV